jgi:hypothetical protein
VVAQELKRIEKEKLALTTRHRVLATVLQRVSTPLKKADLLAVAHHLIGHLSYSQVPTLAKRHKVEAKKDSLSAKELLAKQVGTYDETELCKLLLEPAGLGLSAIDRQPRRRSDGRRKRYRVDGGTCFHPGRSDSPRDRPNHTGRWTRGSEYG